jgi:protein tyrosine phosphatase
MTTSTLNDQAIAILAKLANSIDNYEEKTGSVDPDDINTVIQLLRQARTLMVTNNIDYKSM